MKNGSTIVIGIIILSLIVIGILLSRSSGDSQLQNAVGDSEITKEKTFFSKDVLFELEDYDGNSVSSRDFKQDILVINAWASWCPFCVNELPDFAELQNRFPDDVAVIAINRAEPRTTAKSFSDTLGLNESIVFLVDPDDLFYKSIGGFSMPETLFVNSKGEKILHKRGPMKIDEMVSIVETHINQ